MSFNPIYKPSQILRLIKQGKIAASQPKGEGRIYCEAKHHLSRGDTEAPDFWENGTYTFCRQCNRWALARVEFHGFTIDMTGERKRYPLFMEKAPW